MKYLKQEFKTLLACFSYFTRIPIWKLIDTSDVNMKQTSKYFPLVGLFIGGLSGLIFYWCNIVFPIEIALLLSMSTSLILTGAIHEDGFADVCDGFGAGYTKDRILAIMKDSSTGVFANIGLFIILAIKFFALMSIELDYIAVSMVIAHTLSRWTSISFLYTHEYARESSDSKSTIFVKKPSKYEFLLISFWMLISFLLLPEPIIYQALLLIIPIYLFKFLIGIYFKKKIGGYTGDCMGACQQVAEILFYLGMILITNDVI